MKLSHLFSSVFVCGFLLASTAAQAAGPYYYYLYPSSVSYHNKQVNGGNTIYLETETTSGSQITYNQLTILGNSNPDLNGAYWSLIQSNPLSSMEVIGVQCTSPAPQYSCGTNCVSNNYVISYISGITENCSLIYALSLQ